jgi:hypothetical protein
LKANQSKANQDDENIKIIVVPPSKCLFDLVTILIVYAKDIKPEIEKMSRTPTQESLRNSQVRLQTVNGEFDEEFDFIDFDEHTVEAKQAHEERKT